MLRMCTKQTLFANASGGVGAHGPWMPPRPSVRRDPGVGERTGGRGPNCFYIHLLSYGIRFSNYAAVISEQGDWGLKSSSARVW